MLVGVNNTSTVFYSNRCNKRINGRHCDSPLSECEVEARCLNPKLLCDRKVNKRFQILFQ